MSKLNYFALFLNDDNYLLQCLSLIHYICKPNSKSLPHITLRVAQESIMRNQAEHYFNALNVSYLDLVKPGTFNIDNEEPPYIVYMQCNSSDLEVAQYKPDFPFSKLHISLYEGNDKDFAKQLYVLLEKVEWRVRVKFDSPQYLRENTVGKSLPDQSYSTFLPKLLDNVLSCSEEQFSKLSLNNDNKLKIIDKILEKVEEYCKEANIERLPKRKSINVNKKGVFLQQSETQTGIDSMLDGKIYKQQIRKDEVFFITPPELAYDMAYCTMQIFKDNQEDIKFGEPTVGTGNLFLALRKVVAEENNYNYHICSAIGVDIKPDMVKEARDRCGSLGLKVDYGDAIAIIDTLEKRNLILANPPYNRHEEILKDYRDNLKKLAYQQTHIKISGEAGLYVYHMLIMDKWLEKGGVAAWLIPNAFLQTGYGMAVRQYLVNNVQLVRLHIYDEDKIYFDNVDVIPSLVIMKKQASSDDVEIRITYGKSAKFPDKEIIVTRDTLIDEIDNWRNIKTKDKIRSTDKESIKFSNLFDIKRGLATGANSFFVMQRSVAKKLGIPDIAVKPLLPKARCLDTKIIEAEYDKYPAINNQYVVIDCDLPESIIQSRYPEFYSYLSTAKSPVNGESNAIIDRTLVKGRKPWYKQESRLPAPFLMTYMGRNNLYFVLNKSDALALNTYILLYPKMWLQELLDLDAELYEELLFSLNKTADELLVQNSRIYSGALHKVEPGDLKKLPILYLPKSIKKAWKTLI